MVHEANDCKDALKRLQVIPGVGPSIAGDLLKLGIGAVEDLRRRSPEDLYEAHCIQKGCRVDRCWLYVARCAVYFASESKYDPEKLKWWNWKEKEGTSGRTGERESWGGRHRRGTRLKPASPVPKDLNPG